MFVSISGTEYYSFSIWDDWNESLWLDLLPITWADVLGPKESKVLAGSNPSVVDIVEDRSTADFSILDTAHAYSFVKGEYVEIKDLAQEVIFTGFVDSVTQVRLSPGGILEHRLSCVDNHYLADKRLIATAFVSPSTIATAVHWIVDNILDEEGVTDGTITAPTVIEAISYDYITVSQALDDLAAYAGCTWYIDIDRKLYFMPRTTVAAAWNLTEAADLIPNVLAESFQVYSSNPEYRNQQYIRGGSAKTSLQTEIKVGDGDTSSWAVGFKLAEEPTVSVSTDSGKTYTAKTVGIKGVETGHDWYWSSNDQVVMQDSGAVRLAAGNLLKIEYYGLYQIVISSSDYTEILALQALEGGDTSGKVDAVRDDPLITTQDAGIIQANALLDHYAEIGTKVTYATNTTGLEVGTLQHITSHIHDIDDDFLLTRIEKLPLFYEDGDLTNGLWQYNVEAVSGPVEDYWTKVFLKLNQGNAGSSLSGSTSVVLVLYPLVGVATGDIWDYIVADGASDSDSGEFPSYADGDEIKYISMWMGGVEIFRKYRVSQTGSADTGKFVTTFIIASGECNEEWDTIKVYGGNVATDTLGTGDIIYSVADSYIKNSLISLQIVVTLTEV